MKQKVLEVFSWCTLVSALSLLLLVAYWLYWPDEVMQITSGPMAQTEKKIYRAGERVAYSFSYCKTRPIVGTVSRALVDGTRTTFQAIQSDLPVGCHTLTVCELRVPRNTVPGIYHLEVAGEYRINPLRTHVARFVTNDFEILPSEEVEYFRELSIENSIRLNRLER